jgi:hypothetical protein
VTEHVEWPQAFAVFDRNDPRNEEIIEALGTDAVELQSSRALGGAFNMHFQVKFDALDTLAQLRLSRLLGLKRKIGRDAAFVEAMMIGGLSLAADRIFVCKDPAIGRAYFATLSARRETGNPE